MDLEQQDDMLINDPRCIIENFVDIKFEENEDDLVQDNYKSLGKTMPKTVTTRDSLSMRQNKGQHSMNTSLSFRQKAPKVKRAPPKPVMTKYFSECLEVQ